MDFDYNQEQEYVYEPLKSYKNIFKQRHLDNTTKYFDDLVLKSQIDIEANRLTNKEIDKLTKEKENIKKQLNKKKGLKGFLIFLTIVSIIIAIYGINFLVTMGVEVTQLILSIIGVILPILFIILIIKKINPKIKEFKSTKEALLSKINALISEGYQQMAPLNQLFKKGVQIELFKQTLPLINLDKLFDSKRLDYLTSRFGLNELYDDNRSTLYVQSGDLNGNPFYIARDLVHELKTKVYTGSITIHWTTRRTVNGKSQTVHHSQVLTASVEKPCPYYSEEQYLLYGNEAAPDLIFSRFDSDAEHMDQKQIDRHVNRNIKKLNKTAEKQTKSGQNYTVMANSEFEVLWGASNRNHEVQFRLLFTPLAQKQLLELMKDKVNGYGDNFDFIKHKKLNLVYPEHLANFNLDEEPNYFRGYNYDVIRNNFISYHENYFKHIYFTFAPVLSIPLYQHQKPHEFIYKDLYDSYVSFYEHERVANNMDINLLKHSDSNTRNILKTKIVSSKNNTDQVKVVAYGYRTENRTDYITKIGGDMKPHIIPVHWIEYIPVEKESVINVDVLEENIDDKDLSWAEKIAKKLTNKEEVSKEDLYRVGLLVGYIANKNDKK